MHNLHAVDYLLLHIVVRYYLFVWYYWTLDLVCIAASYTTINSHDPNLLFDSSLIRMPAVANCDPIRP